MWGGGSSSCIFILCSPLTGVMEYGFNLTWGSEAMSEIIGVTGGLSWNAFIYNNNVPTLSSNTAVTLGSNSLRKKATFWFPIHEDCKIQIKHAFQSGTFLSSSCQTCECYCWTWLVSGETPWVGVTWTDLSVLPLHTRTQTALSKKGQLKFPEILFFFCYWTPSTAQWH